MSALAVTFTDVANSVGAFLGLCGIGYLVWVAARGDRNRLSEDEARAFFDEHGRWPDEPEDAAVRREGGYGDVDRLPDEP